MKLYDELVWRGLIKDITSPELKEKLNNGGMSFYIGTDPTADSMHIGHYSSFLISKRLAKAGHHPYLLIGGATGRIGDPRPTAEREMKTEEEVLHNVEGLTKQAKEIFGFDVVNNNDWTKDINIVEFLRDYGKYFSVNYMLDKDIIRRRLETGITFAEFSYMLLQSMDFLWLHENKGVDLQVAGSDQWGNITAGVDLIRKKTGDEVYAFTMPLVLDKYGNKFGKSEGNALWLDKDKTSSYELYQYLINSDDSKVIEYLKIFTFLSKEEIERLEKSNNEHPELREAHQALAREVITDLHGKEEYEKALNISKSLFSGDIKKLNLDEIKVAFKDVPSFRLEGEINIVDMLVNNKIASSKREAREFINAGSITINGDRITDLDRVITKEMAIEGSAIVVRRGKKKYFVGMF